MNQLSNQVNTISSLEVAEMMEVSHRDILRKLEGAKDRKGYIQILAEAQMGVSDYFIESTYTDGSGKTNKSYNCTKLGCEFLANKFTGEKGILFTAKYVKRFNEMEQRKILPKPKSDNTAKLKRLEIMDMNQNTTSEHGFENSRETRKESF